MNKSTFTVIGIGFSEHEQRLLRSIFSLSSNRPRAYTLGRRESHTSADMLLVNGDDEQAVSEYNGYLVGRPDTPTVMVAKHPPEDLKYHYLRRPLIATRVYRCLDKVSVKDLSFTEDLRIGQGGEVSKAVKTALAEPPTATTEHAYTALVVDDSLAVRKLMELELRMYNIQADFAESAERAFELLDHKGYDIVFLDVVLPGVDGYKVCKSIKKNKAKKHTPVIMLTGKSSPFDRVRGKLAGCNTYLTKPVHHNTLKKVISKHLSFIK